MTNGLQTITRAEFKALVLEGKGIFVVDVWAPWCPPCRQMAPYLPKFAAELGDQATIVKIDYDANLDLKPEYGFQGVPALLFFKGGQLVDMAVGFGGYAYLRKQFDDALAKLQLVADIKPIGEEKAFIALATAAENKFEAMQKKFRKAYMKAISKVSRNAKRVGTNAKKALEAGTITQAEHDKRIERAKAKVEPFSKPAMKNYRRKAKPAEAAFVAAIAAAAGTYVEVTSKTSDTAEGATCQIGDPSCRV